MCTFSNAADMRSLFFIMPRSTDMSAPTALVRKPQQFAEAAINPVFVSDGKCNMPYLCNGRTDCHAQVKYPTRILLIL